MEFAETRKTLESLEQLICCEYCKRHSMNLRFIGSCDHVFCSECKTRRIGISCPVCYIPVDTKESRPVRQLTEISELCSRIRKHLDDYEIHNPEDATATTTTGIRRKRSNPLSIKTVASIESKRHRINHPLNIHTRASSSKDTAANKWTAIRASSTVWKLNKKGETELHLACQRGDLDNVRTLLSNNSWTNLNVIDNARWTPLHEACIGGHLDIINYLLDSGAVVDPVGDNWSTPLHLAVQRGHVDVVKTFIHRGADLKVRTRSGDTVLTLAKGEQMEALIREALSNPRITPSPPVIQRNRTMVSVSHSSLNQDQMRELVRMELSPQFIGKMRRIMYFHPIQTTHLVVGSNPTSRSFKYMNAVLSGKWVVTFEWIQACVRDARFVDEDEFEVNGSKANPTSGGPKRARLNFELIKPGLFVGCRFYLCGQFQKPNLNEDQVKELIELGDGSVIYRPPSGIGTDATKPYHANESFNTNTVILYQNEADLKQLRRRVDEVPKAPLSWLFDCIDHFRLLPIPNDQIGA